MLRRLQGSDSLRGFAEYNLGIALLRDGKRPEAIEQAGQLKPDLVVLDLTMPGMDGLEALPLVREASPDTEIVMLTASEDDQNLLDAIRAGAAGYLLKSEPPERIVGFLHGVVNGEAALSGARRPRRPGVRDDREWMFITPKCNRDSP